MCTLHSTLRIIVYDGREYWICVKLNEHGRTYGPNCSPSRFQSKNYRRRRRVSLSAAGR